MNEHVDSKTGEITVELPPNNLPSTIERSTASLESQLQPQSSATFPHIAKAIADVMAALVPVVRDAEHKHFHYKYPTMGGILTELTPRMGAAGLAIIPAEFGEPSFVEGKYVKQKYIFTILHSSGEVWAYPTKWTGLSLALSENGKFDDKCLGKTAVSARKAFLQALFNIPVEDVNAADPDRGDNDHGDTKAPPKTPPAPPKPVVGAKPHTIQITDGIDMAHWVVLYLSYIASSSTGDELKQWDALNDAILTKVSNKDKAAYDQIVAATQKRSKELTVKKPGPPPPPKSQQEKDVELVTGGVTPPGETVWEDPVDGQAWLRDFEGALSACTTPEALEEARKMVGLPAKGKVSTEEWEQGGILLQAAKNRIALEG
jgi:hypothetical protein